LSLSLLLDEDSQAKALVKLLKASGNDVLTVNDAAIAGSPDDQVLDYARQTDRVLLTRNCSDFQELHEINSIHPGILAVYQDPDFSKNMNYQQITQAVKNLDQSSLVLSDQFIVLNQWNYGS
jgi:predicted nuclease of predicted toxin-antitoxin system